MGKRAILRGEIGMVSQTAVFMELVRDHMGPAPPCVHAETPCAAVIAQIREHRATGAIIEDADRQPVGIVTEQDVCRRVVFLCDATTPVRAVMSAPVHCIHDEEFLYQAIARMRRHELRHMPVVGSEGRVVGILHLHAAVSVAAAEMMGHIDVLTHESSIDGMRRTKAAQVSVARQLFADTVPAPEIQKLLTLINNDLYRRIVSLCVQDMALDGWGDPPVDFDVIVMGSGGRGESYLNPDQDNGVILADYPDSEHTRVDGWCIELAKRMTDALDEVGFPYCRGHVMATNPVWRKTASQWQAQVARWVGASEGIFLRLADIFFDFTAVHGKGRLTAALRDYVSRAAQHRFFLREMYRNDEEHGVALGWFGHIKPDPLQDDEEQVNLKLTGTLPLVGAVRILALQAGVATTSTLGRIRALGAAGILSADEQDYLHGAFNHITGLLLRQQIADFEAGERIGNHVPIDALSTRDKDMLIDGFKAIRALRERLRSELTAEIF